MKGDFRLSKVFSVCIPYLEGEQEEERCRGVVNGAAKDPSKCFLGGVLNWTRVGRIEF